MMEAPERVSPGSLAALVITLSLGVALANLLSTQRVYEPTYHKAVGEKTDSKSPWPLTRPKPMPTYSSNDRSRWATVRALVDEKTFEVGKRDPFIGLLSAVAQTGQTDPLCAMTIAAFGLTRRVGSSSGISFEDGWQTVDLILHPEALKFYSTKPPLLPILVAGEYWALQKATGWTLKENPFGVVRVILFTINLLPFLLYLVVLWDLLGKIAVTEWGRLYTLCVAGLGTMVLPFLQSFNNHTMAVFSVLFGIYALVQVQQKLENGVGKSIAGWCFLAGLLAGFAVCNELPSLAFLALAGVFLGMKRPREAVLWYLPGALIPVALLLATNYLALGQWRPAYSEFGGPWYAYEGSHWRVFPGVSKGGIDWARRNGEPIPVYAFHLLLGHHGFFSLTPVFLLSMAGMWWQVRGEKPPSFYKPLARATAILGLVVIVFYIFKSDNYGGFCIGPRWLMWLCPFFLLTAQPVVDALARSRAGRVFALLLLVLSLVGANYPGWNPWRHPWIYDAMRDAGWPGY
ncbi:MAG: hypothetical protein EXR99_06120 [Gemmataceae bacterium]|nr:hypothetical protein [Gemmataceae bacterium]